MNSEGNSSNTIDSKFFYIQKSRFVIMNIISPGIFEVYWMYKNWKYLKERDKMKIHPFWLGVFGIFFIHRLLDSIYNDSEVNSIRIARFSASKIATNCVIFISMIFKTSASRIFAIRLEWVALVFQISSRR